MKVISIQQPFATFIALGVKKFETRSWSTKHRGPIAIHASKKVDNDSFDLLKNELKPFGIFSTEDLPTGVILCTAELIQCHQVVEDKGHSAILNNEQTIKSPDIYLGDFSLGRYAWELQNIKQIKPIPAKGKLSLWEIDENILKQE